MPSCFFRKPKKSASDYQSRLLFYRGLAEQAIGGLGDDYQIMQDIQGRHFSVTHVPMGLTLEVHGETAIDFWASIVAALDRIKDAASAEVFRL